MGGPPAQWHLGHLAMDVGKEKTIQPQAAGRGRWQQQLIGEGMQFCSPVAWIWGKDSRTCGGNQELPRTCGLARCLCLEPPK